MYDVSFLLIHLVLVRVLRGLGFHINRKFSILILICV